MAVSALTYSMRDAFNAKQATCYEVKGALLCRAFAHSSQLHEILPSWDNLPEDQYRPTNQRDRQRRYSYFHLVNGILSEPQNKPYFQAPDVNQLVGGIMRDFKPIEDNIIHHPLVMEIIENDIAICLSPEEIEKMNGRSMCIKSGSLPTLKSRENQRPKGHIKTAWIFPSFI